MKKFSIISLLIVLLGIFCCVSCGYLLSSAIIINLQSTATLTNAEQTVYAISTYSSKSLDEVKAQVVNLQKDGGAGFVYEYKDEYRLIASIYENLPDAEKVKKNFETTGKNVEILSITLASTKIEGNFESDEKSILQLCLKARIENYKSLYDVAISLDTNVFDESKAKIECNNIFSNHISKKTNFETFFKNASTSALKSLEKQLKNSYDALQNLVDEKYENQSQTYSSLIKLTYCKILLEN